MCKLQLDPHIERRKPTKVLLSWNGKLDIKVDKLIVSESCQYLRALLLGDFSEKEQERIEIFIDVPCDVFESALIFAEHKILPPFAKIPFYLNLLELASMWCFDKLRDEIEIILIGNIDMQTICDIHSAANIWNLPVLQNECEYYEFLAERNAQPIYRYWPIGKEPQECPINARTTIRSFSTGRIKG